SAAGSRSYGLCYAVFDLQKLTTSPRDEHFSRICQIPIRMFSKKDPGEGFVPTLRQRLKCFQRMLITQSDDGYFRRNPETRLAEARFTLEEVWCVQ
ncbi:MAG: hypothetical protein WCH39_29275, partial [Schlesneria sp.]